jgi:hypothetical protein
MLIAHVDDIMVTGPESDVKTLVDAMSEIFLIKVTSVLRPHETEEAAPQHVHKFLSKHRFWTKEGLITKCDPCFIEQSCELVEMNPDTLKYPQCPVWKPGPSEAPPAPLEKWETSLYRSVVGKLVYTAPEQPSVQIALKEVSRRMQNPTTHDMCALRHLVRFMASRRGHGYLYDAKFLNEIHVKTDADWAKDPETRKSTDCITVFYHNCCMSVSTKQQSIIAQSSAEAELLGMTRGMMTAVYLQNLVAELRLKGLGDTSPKITLWSDSSAARSIAQRKGASIKRLSIKQLWIQSVVGTGRAELRKIASEVNEADIGTKAFSIDRIRQLEKLLGYTSVMSYRTHGEERTTSKQRRSTFSTRAASYLSIATIAAEATAARCENTPPTSTTGWNSTIFDLMLYIFAIYGFIRCILDMYNLRKARRRGEHDLMHDVQPPSLRDRFYRNVYVTKGSSDIFHESQDCQKNLKRLRVCLLCYRRDVRDNIESSRNDETRMSTTSKTRRDAGK